jgi:hypothetical protein
MKTKRIFLLIAAAALSLTTSVAAASMRGSPIMARSGMTRPAPRFAPGTTMGTHRFFNDRFHRFHNRTFVFVDTFNFPFFYPFPYPYPYPYYGYYPYGYDGYYGSSGYGYSNTTVVEVQRRLARAGYYHGPIDGIMGRQTRRAIRAYERHRNMPAYG